MTSLRYKKFFVCKFEIYLLTPSMNDTECKGFSALKVLDATLPSVETIGLFACHISTQLHLIYGRLILFQLRQRRSGTCQCNLRQFRFNCFLFISSVSLLRKLIAAAAACLSLLAKACVLVCFVGVCVAVMCLLAPDFFFLAKKRLHGGKKMGQQCPTL